MKTAQNPVPSMASFMLCGLLVAAQLLTSSAQTTPSPTPKSNATAPATLPPMTASATPVVTPPRQAPVASPPIVPPPTAASSTSGANIPSSATKAPAAPVVAPTAKTPTVAPATPAVAPAAKTPAAAPTATVLNTAPSPSLVRAPGPSTLAAVVPAPGPSNGGTVNATISLPSQNGALSASQQQQLCNLIVLSLRSNFSTIQTCAVTSQTASSPASFAATGRRLHQTSSTLLIGLSLSSASTQQVPAIQAAINNINIIIGTNPPATLVVIVIVFVPGLTVPSNITSSLPPSTSALPPSTVVALAPSGSTAQSTVTTAVPSSATGNTTQNVSISNAVPPSVPAGATTTNTTVTNTTTTTTIVTISIYITSSQTTAISQYFFTFAIGSKFGTFTIVTFFLPGNVANNLPLVITGGATTGSSASLKVTGPTVAIIISQQITTSTATTTTTSTSTATGTMTTSTTGTGTGGSTGTGTGTSNKTTNTIVSGVTRQVCSVPNNPYGLIQNTANEGTLVKGAFLVSSWNSPDANNFPGQGRLIYQCMPNGTTSVWSNVTISGACTLDQAGVGVTMALSRCGSVIIVGSLPILPGGNPNPGCLIALDLTGKTVGEVKSPYVNGPWGSVCTSSGNQIILAVSSVLGGLGPSAGPSAAPAVAPSTTASSGKRLLQAPASSTAISGGFVARWTFTTPTLGSTWSLGTATLLVTGISTNGSAASVEGGTVGPGGLTIDDAGTLYIPDNVGNRVLALPSGLTTATSGQATALAVSNSGINGPNSVTYGGGQLLGTNTQDGNLFFVTLNSARNGGVGAVQLVDPNNTPGVLFQAIFSVDASAGAPVGSIWFQHDGSNTLNTVTTSGTPAPNSAPGLAPSRAPATGR